ncbi:MAG: PAS domain-containing protein, partial [Chloroflexaceae bacterium]|nr:PAS domain-containing protein [Chloroflexaceae bacterium]
MLNEQLVQSIERTATDQLGLAVLDRELRYLEINEVLAAYNGLPPEAHLGRTTSEMVPELAAKLNPLLRQVLDTGQPLENVEVYGTTPAQAGQRRWSVSYYPVRARSGLVLGVEVVAQELPLQPEAFALPLSLNEHRVFEYMTQASPDLIYLYDLDAQRNIYANRELGTILGYTSEQLHELGANFLMKLVHPEDAFLIPKALARLAHAGDGELVETEYRLRRADGRYVWLRSRDLVFERHADDRPQFVLGFAQDITSQKEVESMLRKQTAWLELALEVSTAGAWDWNFQTNHHSWSESFYRLFELDPQLHSPSPECWFERIHPDDRAQMNSSLGEALADNRERISNEYRTILPDGTIRWIRVDGRMFRDESGQVVRATGICQDVSAEKAAKAALSDSQQQLRTLADTVPQIIWITSADGTRFDYLNQRWYEYTGRFALGETPESAITAIHPDDVPGMQAIWQQSVALGETFEYELRIRGADSIYRWFLVRTVPMRNAAGVIERWVGSSTDIDASKRALERKSRLQRLAEALSAALTPEQVAEAILNQTMPALGAAGGAVRLLNQGSNSLDALALRNADNTRFQPWLTIPLSTVVPVTDAVKNHQL